MNNEEQYQSLLTLAKQALMFYANENNYTFGMVAGNFSQIELDKGFQAKFALQQMEQLEQLNFTMISDFSTIKFEEPITNIEEITKLIKDDLTK